MLKAHSRLLEQGMLVGDLALVAACWIAAYALRFHVIGPIQHDVPPLSDYLLMLLPILVVWGLSFRAFGLYRPRRIGSHLSEAADVAKAVKDLEQRKADDAARARRSFNNSLYGIPSP